MDTVTSSQYSKTWDQLDECSKRNELTIESLFNKDPKRAQRYSIHFDDLYVDYSKQLIDGQILDLLIELANSRNLKAKIEAMFTGEAINRTEKRAALHTALRSKEESVFADGRNVIPLVAAERDRMLRFADFVSSGMHRGATGEPIKSVVNIGIGGSDLGPAMASQALTSSHTTDIVIHYVSNVDPTELTDVLSQVDAGSTLFVIASKTFTTSETMTNAELAKEWLVTALGEEAVESHFVALSTNQSAVQEFGISTRHTFGFWDWVGGRFSLASSIGLSLAIAIGSDGFRELLDGMEAADSHFRSTDLDNNLPVILALIGIWNNNFLGINSHAVIPYSNRLAKLPAFLQQLEMESNGKSVSNQGEPVEHTTSPIIWGEPGTNSQHAFFQQLHQGTIQSSVDFIGLAKSETGETKSQQILNANMLAQSRALAFGREHDNPHQKFEGNRPSTTIIMSEISPRSLGILIALFEHKVFVQGVLWDINSFDQFGVELGKKIASEILETVSSSGQLEFDSSTNRLIETLAEKSK